MANQLSPRDVVYRKGTKEALRPEICGFVDVLYVDGKKPVQAKVVWANGTVETLAIADLVSVNAQVKKCQDEMIRLGQVMMQFALLEGVKNRVPSTNNVVPVSDLAAPTPDAPAAGAPVPAKRVRRTRTTAAKQ